LSYSTAFEIITKTVTHMVSTGNLLKLYLYSLCFNIEGFHKSSLDLLCV